MKWWSNSEELRLAAWICESLNIDTIPAEGSLGAKLVVPQDRLEEVLSFISKNGIKFWTSYESKSIMLYILKQ